MTNKSSGPLRMQQLCIARGPRLRWPTPCSPDYPHHPSSYSCYCSPDLQNSTQKHRRSFLSSEKQHQPTLSQRLYLQGIWRHLNASFFPLAWPPLVYIFAPLSVSSVPTRPLKRKEEIGTKIPFPSSCPVSLGHLFCLKMINNEFKNNIWISSYYSVWIIHIQINKTEIYACFKRKHESLYTPLNLYTELIKLRSLKQAHLFS